MTKLEIFRQILIQLLLCLTLGFIYNLNVYNLKREVARIFILLMLALSTFILNVLIKIQKNREELAEINQAEEDFFEYLELVEEALEEDPEELEENLPQFNKILSRS